MYSLEHYYKADIYAAILYSNLVKKLQNYAILHYFTYNHDVLMYNLFVVIIIYVYSKINFLK